MIVHSLPPAVLQLSADVFSRYGWSITFPKVGTISDEDEFVQQGAFVAYAVPGEIVFTEETMASVRILYRAVSKDSPTSRRVALHACAMRCVDALAVELHEFAHEVQFEMGADLSDADIEGGAEAVAQDLLPVVWKKIGGTPLDLYLWRMDIAYHQWTVAYRLDSASATCSNWTSPEARSARFRKLGGLPPERTLC